MMRQPRLHAPAPRMGDGNVTLPPNTAYQRTCAVQRRPHNADRRRIVLSYAPSVLLCGRVMCVLCSTDCTPDLCCTVRKVQHVVSRRTWRLRHVARACGGQSVAPRFVTFVRHLNTHLTSPPSSSQSSPTSLPLQRCTASPVPRVLVLLTYCTVHTFPNVFCWRCSAPFPHPTQLPSTNPRGPGALPVPNTASTPPASASPELRCSPFTFALLSPYCQGQCSCCSV